MADRSWLYLLPASVQDRMFDSAFDTWLQAGHYASRPPGEVHGLLRTEHGCIILEVSIPNRTA